MTYLSPLSGREIPALKSKLQTSMTTTGAQAPAGGTATARPAPPSVTASWPRVTMTSP